LSLLLAMLTLLVGYSLGMLGVKSLGADTRTAALGQAYLAAFIPSLALVFPLSAISSALRASGVVGAPMAIQSLTVLLNALLAPVLIAGWGTGRPLGVAGAGIASSIAIAAGVLLMMRYFHKNARIRFDPSQLRVQRGVWSRILKIGLPSGGEFALMFLFMGVIYYVIREFGAAAQAGYGIGSRVMQAVFLPAMAVAFATAPVAGQNFGAGRSDRVRETFRSAAILGSIIMLIPTFLCQLRPEWLIRGFSNEPDVIALGADYLRVISLNFVVSGLIFTCSGMFQALGNTIPSLISSGTRLVTFALPALWLSTRPGFTLHQVWILSVITTAAQAVLSVLLLRRQLHRHAPLAPVVPAHELASPL
jgi:putative MATE family efflux protein